MNFKHTGKFVLATALAVFFVFSILGIHNVVTSSGGVAFFGRVARDIKNSFHFGLGFLSNSRAAVLGAGSELILNWQFDEFGGSLASDASSNGRHGNVSLENPFTYIARDFRSIQFNGSNLYVYNHALPAQSGDFSVSLWFKTNAGGTVFEYANSSNSGVRLYFENEILKMGGSGGPSTVLSQGVDIADSKWHHAVVLRSGSLYRLYVDGVLVGERSGSITSYSKFNVGNTTSNTEYFNGFIDEVRVYGRALSVSEISEIHNELVVRSAAYWNFDNYQGGDVADLSGGNNLGQLSGSPRAVPGKFGLGLFMDGADNNNLGHVNVASSDDLVVVNSDVSMCMWIKRTGNKEGGLAGKGFGAVHYTYGLYTLASGEVIILLGNANAATPVQASLATEYILPLNTWANVCLTIDDVGSSTNVELWADAQKRYSNGNQTRIGDNGTGFAIGYGAKNGFTALTPIAVFDQVEIFRRKLSDNDIQKQFQQGSEPVLSGAMPSGILPANTTSATLRINSNQAATCRYSTIPNIDYEAMVQTWSTTGGTAHANPVATVDGEQYTYYVRCENSIGVSNIIDTPIQFSIAPKALVHLDYNEGTGTAITNRGTLGGTFSRTNPIPAWSLNAPANIGAGKSLDFGTIVGANVVEGSAPLSGLGGLGSLTITGWVNNKSPTTALDGNRVVSWLNSGRNAGAELVLLSDGSLKFAVNQAPDWFTPSSSAGKISTDSASPAGNWRFFAVTYDGALPSNTTQFYFGSETVDALFDVARSYARGSVASNVGTFASGNANAANRPVSTDAMFRGIMDDVRVYGRALSLEDIIMIQRGTSPAVVKSTVTISNPSSGGGSGDYTTGLVSRWKFESNAQDSVGTNHGSALNGPTYGAGKDGNAIFLNATQTNQEVSIADAGLPNFNAGAPYTISTWFNATSYEPYQALFDKGQGGTSRDYSFFISSPTGGWNAYGKPSNAGAAWSVGTPGFTSGVWHHFAAVRNGTSVDVYLDGSKKFTAPASTNDDSGGRLSIGANPTGGGASWKGGIDDFRIYTGALDATKINQIIASAGSAGAGDGSGRVSADVISDSGPIDCASGNIGLCIGQFDQDTSVQFSAIPDAGSQFISWGGDCSGSLTNCPLTLNSDKNITAQFSQAPAGSGAIKTKRVGEDFNMISGTTYAIDGGAPSGVNDSYTDGISTGQHTVSVTDLADMQEAVFVCTYPLGGTVCGSVNEGDYSTASIMCGVNGACQVEVNVSVNTVTKVVVRYTLRQVNLDVSVLGGASGGDYTDFLVAHFPLDWYESAYPTKVDNIVLGGECVGSNGATCAQTYNSPTVVAGKLPTHYKAFSFNGGSNQYIDAGNYPSYGSDYTAWTTSAWIKVPADATGAGSSYRSIMAKQSAYGMFLKDNRLYVYDWGANQEYAASGALLNDNLWHHVACSYQSGVTSGTKCYVDGVNVLSGKITVANHNQSLEIGRGGDVGQYFRGVIDDSRLYSAALTAAQIQQIYSSSSSCSGSVTSNIGGINCSPTGGVCTGLYDQNTSVTLTANPNPGCKVTWGDACTIFVSSATCQLTLSSYSSVLATFSQGEESSGDTTPPVVSHSVPPILPAGEKTKTLSISTDKPSTCRYDTSSSSSYGTMTGTFSSSGGLNHSASLTLACSDQSYTYYVSCSDASGNISNPLGITFSYATPAPTNFIVGQRVTTTANANVRASQQSVCVPPSGVQSKGKRGVIETAYNPALHNKDGYVWWKVDFDTDPDGWVVQDNLTVYRPPSFYFEER